MTEKVSIRVRPLRAADFEPYGRVIEGESLGFPEVEEGRVGVENLRLRYRPQGSQVEQLAVHFSYNQTFIPTTGSMILVVAPPPGNREEGEHKGPDAYQLDYERLAAFTVTPGQAAQIDKGTWHNAITLDPECQFINITRKNEGEGRSPAEELEGRIEAAHAARDYVEFVDVRKRDGRIIQLEI